MLRRIQAPPMVRDLPYPVCTPTCRSNDGRYYAPLSYSFLLLYYYPGSKPRQLHACIVVLFHPRHELRFAHAVCCVFQHGPSFLFLKATANRMHGTDAVQASTKRSVKQPATLQDCGCRRLASECCYCRATHCLARHAATCSQQARLSCAYIQWFPVHATANPGASAGPVAAYTAQLSCLLCITAAVNAL